MAQKRPHYSYADFVKACAAGNAKAFVSGGAMITAKQDFKFETQEKVLSFIANGGLEAPEFANCEVWGNNPNKKTPIMVDSWNFFSGTDYGYIAYLHQPTTNKWIIKSFKKNEKSDPRNLPFANLGSLVATSGAKHE